MVPMIRASDLHKSVYQFFREHGFLQKVDMMYLLHHKSNDIVDIFYARFKFQAGICVYESIDVLRAFDNLTGWTDDPLIVNGLEVTIGDGDDAGAVFWEDGFLNVWVRVFK